MGGTYHKPFSRPLWPQAASARRSADRQRAADAEDHPVQRALGEGCQSVDVFEGERDLESGEEHDQAEGGLPCDARHHVDGLIRQEARQNRRRWSFQTGHSRAKSRSPASSHACWSDPT